MNIWENTVITAKGVALLSKLVQGNTLTITKAVSGAGYVTPGMLQNQTAVANPKQALNFRSFSFPSEGKSEVTCYLTNDGLTEAYTAQQIGVYAKDPDEGDILFFITQAVSGTGTIVPTETESPGFSAEWSFTFPYGRADTVSVTVDPSNTVTQASMEAYVAEAISPLWPTKEATGSVICVDDSANLPFVGLHIYGKSTQDGTPTPDNPVELVKAGAVGTFKATVYGKNLFNVDSITGTKDATGATQGAGFYNVTNGVITNNQGLYGMSNYFLTDLQYLPRGTYVISCDVKSDHDRRFRLGFFTNNGRYGQEILLASEPTNWEHISVTVEIPINSVIDGVQLQAPGTSETFSSNNAQFRNVQIEAGTAESDFESCKAAQILIFYTENGLSGVPVKNGGNYTDENGQAWVCDEIDLTRGVKVQRTFTETVTLSYDEPYSRYVGELSKPAALGCAEGRGIPLLSNILLFNPEASLGSNGIRISSSGNKMLIACYNQEVIESATVVYPLETPIETALSSEEITAYKALTMNNPCTTVLNDAGAGMKVAYITDTFEQLMRSINPTMAVYTVNETTAEYNVIFEEVFSSTDVNKAKKFIVVDNSTTKYAGYWSFELVKYTEVACVVTGYRQSSYSGGRITKARGSNGWMGFSWDNPQMTSGEEYRLSSWWYGYPQFAMLIPFGPISNGMSVTFDIEGLNAIDSIDITVGGRRVVPSISGTLDNADSIYFEHTDKGFKVFCGANYVGWSGWAKAIYRKTNPWEGD